MTIVEVQSPGRMIEGSQCDPLDAWQDCYAFRPKKLIKKDDAKAEILRAWTMWDGDKAPGHAMFLFYGWLQRHRPYFLTFRTKGDRWQTVHSWLLRYEDTKGIARR